MQSVVVVEVRERWWVVGVSVVVRAVPVVVAVLLDV